MTIDNVLHDALERLGVERSRFDRFLAGESLVFYFDTELEPGIGVVRRMENRLQCGIVQIHDPGGGLKSLARFRSRAFAVAAASGASELELFGAAVINQELELLLKRQGFTATMVLCPDELGDEEMEIWSRVFEVD